MAKTPAPQPTASQSRAATPKKPSTPAKPAAAGAAPIDFSGIWELDNEASVNVNYHLDGAGLSVTQKGDHIWIQPIKQGKGSGVMGEEIVADGRAYEKALGRRIISARAGNATVAKPGNGPGSGVRPVLPAQSTALAAQAPQAGSTVLHTPSD